MLNASLIEQDVAEAEQGGGRVLQSNVAELVRARVLEWRAMRRFHLALGVSDVEPFPPSVR
jgi:hypothetical protein